MADIDAARLELEEALGKTEVLSDPLALTLYARDASMVEGGCALVAFPHTVEDVVACVRVAARHALPVVPRGSGTVSAIIAGGVVPAAVEMMDHGIIVAAETFAHAGYPTDAAAVLIVEVAAPPEA